MMQIQVPLTLIGRFAQIVREYTGPPIEPPKPSFTSQPGFRISTAIAIALVVCMVIFVVARRRKRRS